LYKILLTTNNLPIV